MGDAAKNTNKRLGMQRDIGVVCIVYSERVVCVCMCACVMMNEGVPAGLGIAQSEWRLQHLCVTSSVAGNHIRLANVV